MTYVNLLPWREQQRTAIKQRFLRNLFSSIIITVSVIILLHIILAHSVSQQMMRNNYLTNQTKRYDQPLQQLNQLQQSRNDLLQHLQAIHQVQMSRALVVNLFNTMVDIVPDGVYLTSVVRNNDMLNLTGQADSNAQVSHLLRNATVSPWLTAAKLKIIRINNNHPSQRDFELSAQTNKSH